MKENSVSQMEKSSWGKKTVLGFQNLMMCFGATVLVPLLLGINVGLALISAGVGTLIFHVCTRGKVPVYLGSSFAFLPAVGAAIASYGLDGAMSGVIAAGVIYIFFAFIVKGIGVEKVMEFFPPVVTGPMIILIGLILAPSAIGNVSAPIGEIDPVLNWVVMGVTVLTVFLVMAKGKKMVKAIPILIALPVGYILAVLMGMVNIDSIVAAEWLNLPQVTAPRLDWGAIIMVAPLASVTFVEHIADIQAVSDVTGNNIFKRIGLFWTILGDGLATIAGGGFCGIANTTYSEGTGAMVLTKNYDPWTFRIAAGFAIVLGFCGKFVAILQTIPGPVIGGISMIVFGSIAATGLRTMIDKGVNLSKARNIAIVSTMLVFGFVPAGTIVIAGVSISGLTLAALAGVVLNKVWKEKPEELD